MQNKLIQTGDIISLSTRVKVREIATMHTIGGTILICLCQDLETGKMINLELPDYHLENHLSNSEGQITSADYFSEELEVTRTEMIKKFIESTGKVLTVWFKKVDGSDRKARCAIVKPEHLFGRTIVTDFDKEVTTPFEEWGSKIQVDHRTIYQLIVSGVKYTIKKKGAK